MFYDEKVLLDIRLNILNEFVDYFVIVESRYFHNGLERNLNFNINEYPKFKDKIIYIIHENKPKELKKINPEDGEELKTFKLNFNAHTLENNQRNDIFKGVKNADANDMILISDVDEIPNLENINLKQIKNQIILFEQEIFYYKLNRYLPNFIWYGTKACKKKNLISPQWLRNIKNNRYSLFRLDTFFSKKKYINKLYVNKGGWHFSNLKNASDIELKLKSYLHYTDYQFEELGKNKIENLINSNKTIYDMFADKKSNKFGDDKRKDLVKYEVSKLPSYIKNNLNKYKDWID
tara:strand:+ start:2464 stop:3339 length:876 start_codon:yes stop_codon:yes gene_type:complete